jgi:hypothetical protein
LNRLEFNTVQFMLICTVCVLLDVLLKEGVGFATVDKNKRCHAGAFSFPFLYPHSCSSQI